MKINRVLWRHEDTLYSYLDVLRNFPSDPSTAADFSTEKAGVCSGGDPEKNPIKNNVDRSRNPFFVGLNQGSFLSKLRDDLGFLTVIAEDGAEPIQGVRRIDVSKNALLRFTNTANTGSDDDLSFAQCFTDLAISAGAASMLVVRDEWFSKGDPALSEYRGVILIDSDAFLDHVTHKSFASLDDGESEITFPVPWQLGDLSSLVIAVNPEPVNNLSTGDTPFKPECPDFMLVDPRVNFERGYHVTIKDQTDDEAILQFVFNVSPKPTLGAQIGAPLLGLRNPYKRAKLE